jgi:sugar lactone lactonase YvrE
MIRFHYVACAALLGAPLVFAVETRSWIHNGQSDFEKGTLKNLSLRSDGRLTLAPVFRELADPAAAYLWAVAADSKGNVYTGGGGPSASSSKLTVVDSAGKSRTVAELPGLQIQSIAIDRGDRVYAATAPDGKVYRVAADGKFEVFYDPKAKYIWSIAFNSKGELFVATGDAGEVHRVMPDGKGSVFFRTEETHARSMAIDAKDNVIVGTEPGGLVVRVSPAGEGFVLYQAGKREVTSVAVARDGAIYAAAVGTKGTTSAPSLSISLPPPPPAPQAAAGAARSTIQPVPVQPPATSAPASVAGGSEVYRISADGYPQRVWQHAQDVVYAIAFDAQGRAILGTGNKGNIYRIHSELVSTLLINAAPTQITALAAGPNGRIYASTGNVGKLYAIGPELEKSGTYESDPLDVGAFAYWGRVVQKTEGGQATIETRSGNLDRPQKNWSPWAPLDAAGRIASPSARFLQYRITLTAGEMREIELAYMARNAPPAIEEVEITQPNYRFTTPATITPATQTLTLPALGARRRTVPSISLDSGSGSQTMTFAKGHRGARWAATDPNADDMIYRVEIRGLAEREWKLLREKVKEKFLSWDSTAYPDGEYLLRVTASDAPDNAPDHALTSQLESERFTIDNTAPQITGLAGTRSGNKLAVKWHARDNRSLLSRAEYSLNGGDWIVVEPVTRLSDSPELEYALSLESSGPETTVAVRVSDEFDNQTVDKVIVR